VTVRLVAEARNPASGMTLAELEEFVQQAKAHGCSGTDAVKATLSMRGRVKTLSLAAPR
jgi:hypothetical protein